MEIKKILVIRFRQMGDAVLATPLLNTLRHNYPMAQIDFVLNERIAPLFEGHPSISHIITFSDQERHHTFTYLKKVWRIVRETHYDVIIDMRSTVNTMLFAAFSPCSVYRIGIRKPYTRFIFNHRLDGCADNENMIDHNLKLLSPLGQMDVQKSMTLQITEQECLDFCQYMQRQGLNFNHPIMLAGVTAKLANKTWAEERMIETLRRFVAAYPSVQIIFNFAPGQEAENVHRIYDALEKHPNLHIDIEAKSMRQLAAMAANCTFYFGNEGGARHIAQAMGLPSLVVCSPTASKVTWLPENDKILTRGIAAIDLSCQANELTYEEQYALITVDVVWERLVDFYRQVVKEFD